MSNAQAGIILSKREVLRCLLQGTAGSLAEGVFDEERDADDNSTRTFSTDAFCCNYSIVQTHVQYVLAFYQAVISNECQESRYMWPNCLRAYLAVRR
ncbi:hypothetical protein ACLOJK_007746 [Asimina triloba]